MEFLLEKIYKVFLKIRKCLMLKRYPLLILAAFWVLGIYLSTLVMLGRPVLIGLLLFGVALTAFSIKMYQRRGLIWLLLLMISLLLFAFVRGGWFQHEQQSSISEEMVQQLAEKSIGVRGYFVSTPIIDGNLVKFNLAPLSLLIDNQELFLETNEELLVYLYLDQEEQLAEVQRWYAGQSIRLFGKIDEIAQATNPGQFTYRKYLERKGVYWRVIADNFAGIAVSEGNKAISGFQKFRAGLLAKVDQLFAEPQAGFMKAILLGYRNDLDKDIREDFAILGLSHLLAISGLHLSILTMMFYWLFLKMGLTKQQTIYLVSLFLVGYMFLTGVSASVVRATIMTILMFSGLIFKNRFSALQSLGLAVILMTLVKPNWIFDVGFQLSVMITFYIIAFLPLVAGFLPITNKYWKNALALVIVTQLAAFPLVFYYFHQFSILGWLVNLLIVPLFSILILPIGVMALFLAGIKLYIGNFLALVLDGLIAILLKIIAWAAGLNIFHFYGHFPSFYIVLLLYAILSWFLFRQSIQKAFIAFRLKKAIFFLEKTAILLLSGLLIWSWTTADKGMITFIDVGQGDSILIQAAGNKTVLIDSGGIYQRAVADWQKRQNPFDIGEDVVLPYLHYQGIKSLDVAVLTHEDLDHIGGFLTLVEKIKIEYFVVNKGFPRTPLGEELYNKLQQKNSQIIYLDNIKELAIAKDAKLTFVPVELPGSNKTNDHTLGIYLTIGNTDLFFAADIESAGEEQLLKKNQIRQVDVLKVGHHGSNTSTKENFLSGLKPETAVISVGRRNIYGHPTDQVIERLTREEIDIYRTDLDGAVLLHIKNNGYFTEKAIP